MERAGRVRVGDFYSEAVLPALAEQLDRAFPEFGWRRDARGWVATNEEMTHRVLGARAERVVAHGPAPHGFLVHGGELMLWTAYVNGGTVPRGEAFARAVTELARRAGVDPSPVEQPVPRNRRTDLLHDFFTLCRWELATDRGLRAREYLERRGLPADAIERSGLGFVPNASSARNGLRAAGYSDREIAQSRVISDTRWPERLCGAWRDESGRVKTLWARSLADSAADESRYLYLAGASRSGLPPYGLSWVLKETPRPRNLVLVEGLLDVHHLRARGITNIAALGGTATRAELFERLAHHGFESVTLCLDHDTAGRAATDKAIDQAARARRSPTIFVVDPERLAPTKDPDAFVRERGVETWEALVATRGCAVTWRALRFTRDIGPHPASNERREALARAGAWLGSLPPRLALDQEDALRAVATRCGYSLPAVERAFRARFWQEPSCGRTLERARGL
jgi:hypothetical protein